MQKRLRLGEKWQNTLNKKKKQSNIIEYCASEMKVHMQRRGTKTS